MLININVDLPGPSSPPRRQLPPQLVQFGTEGLVLIELQGALDVEGSKDGQLVGKLCVDPATVSLCPLSDLCEPLSLLPCVSAR